MNLSVTEATPSDAPTVAALTAALLSELDGGNAAVTANSSEPIASDLLKSGRFWSLIAKDPDNVPVGILNLNECAAIYAGGVFGEITELYVHPQARSAGAGRRLIDAAKKFAEERGWKRLEVGAPPEAEWPRTLGFYRACGFLAVGPRLKLPKDQFQPH